MSTGWGKTTVFFVPILVLQHLLKFLKPQIPKLLQLPRVLQQPPKKAEIYGKRSANVSGTLCSSRPKDWSHLTLMLFFRMKSSVKTLSYSESTRHMYWFPGPKGLPPNFSPLTLPPCPHSTHYCQCDNFTGPWIQLTLWTAGAQGWQILHHMRIFWATKCSDDLQATHPWIRWLSISGHHMGLQAGGQGSCVLLQPQSCVLGGVLWVELISQGIPSSW